MLLMTLSGNTMKIIEKRSITVERIIYSLLKYISLLFILYSIQQTVIMIIELNNIRSTPCLPYNEIRLLFIEAVMDLISNGQYRSTLLEICTYSSMSTQEFTALKYLFIGIALLSETFSYIVVSCANKGLMITFPDTIDYALKLYHNACFLYDKKLFMMLFEVLDTLFIMNKLPDDLVFFMQETLTNAKYEPLWIYLRAM
jgi:hypothetical protein